MVLMAKFKKEIERTFNLLEIKAREYGLSFNESKYMEPNRQLTVTHTCETLPMIKKEEENKL